MLMTIASVVVLGNQVLNPGVTVDVPAEIGQAWISSGLAVSQESQPEPEAKPRRKKAANADPDPR